MRNDLRIRLTLAVFLCFWFALANSLVGQEPGQVAVAFLPDGRCTVSAGGEGFHSALTYTPTSRVAGQFRCAIPPVPAGRQVALELTLPPGARPAETDTPKLKWAERAGVWVGTAVLQTAPEVVVVTEWGSPQAVRARVLRRAAAGAGVALFAALGWGWSRRRRATAAG
jgi:hypothetical protein